MKYAKVIASTYKTNDTKREMIGGVFEVRIEDHEDDTLCVWTKNKSDYGWFNLSDVQEVVLDKDDKPVKIGDECVCVGDEYNGLEIYDWYVYTGITRLLSGNKKESYNFAIGTYNDTFKPKHPSRPTVTEMTVAQVEERLGITNLKIVK